MNWERIVERFIDRIVPVFVFVTAIILGILIAKLASAQSITDPLSTCEPDSAANCLCDPYDPELPCYFIPGPQPQQAWLTTGRIHVVEFQILDPGPWGFGTGTYRSKLQNCDSQEWPPDACPLNGFFHMTTGGFEQFQFWLEGPAYDDSGAIIFGTHADRLLITIDVETRTCSSLRCQHNPTRIDFNVDGVSFLNGLLVQPASFALASDSIMGEWVWNFDLSLFSQSLWSWTDPSGEDVLFEYSTVFGSPILARLRLDPYSTDVRRPNFEAAFSPHLFAYEYPDLPRHYLPEPSAGASIALGALSLAALRRRARR